MALTAEQKKQILKDPAFLALINKKTIQKQPLAKETPGYLERLGGNYKNALSEYKEGITRSANEVQKGNIAGVYRGALRPAGTTARVVFAPITEALSPLFQKAINKIGDNETVQNIANSEAISSFLDHVDKWQQNNPEAAKDVKDVFDIINALSADKGIKKTGEITKQAGQKAVAQTGKAASEIKSGTGKSIELAGEKIYKSADPFTPNMSEAQKLINFRSKNSLAKRTNAVISGDKLEGQPLTIADTANKYNLMGTKSAIGVQAKSTMKNIWDNNIKKSLGSIKEKISKDAKFKEIQTEIDDIADLSQKEIMQHSFDKIKDTYKNVKWWSYDEAQDLKSSLTKRIPESVWRGKPTGAINEVNKIFSDILRKTIRGKMDDYTASLYDDYGNLKIIADRGAAALTHPERLGGSGKLFWGSIEKATTPIKTVGGKILQKLGQSLK